MKHLGLAYAGDPLGTIAYVGVQAGMVIVSAGDPGMVVSPNEQDQRLLARMNFLPVLEPSTFLADITTSRTNGRRASISLLWRESRGRAF